MKDLVVSIVINYLLGVMIWK